MLIALTLIGLVAGFALGAFWKQLKTQTEREAERQEWQRQHVSKDELDRAHQRIESLETQRIERSLYEALQSKYEGLQQEIRQLEGQWKEAESARLHLLEKLEHHKEEVSQLQIHFQKEFENLSQRILETKSEKFLKINEENVAKLLNPLRERIQLFEEKVEKSNKDQIAYSAALREQLSHISLASQKMSEDTLRLTRALKGDKKLQGDWGEMQLEAILKAAGLEEGIHYEAQPTYNTEEGSKQRLDYLIKLPDDKHLIIDAKVSLVDYDRHLDEAISEEEQRQALKSHIRSIEKHIDTLGSRNYQKLEGLHSPDYVMMFIPIEPALYVALREEPRLFEKALEKNVVLVTTSTLLATLRTVSYIWKQEFQNRNVKEIARESGALYDKFVGLMEDLLGVGKRLEDTRKEYSAAMNKLFESPRKGDTVVGRIERIKALGADATKQLPQNLLDRIKEGE